MIGYASYILVAGSVHIGRNLTNGTLIIQNVFFVHRALCTVLMCQSLFLTFEKENLSKQTEHQHLLMFYLYLLFEMFHTWLPQLFVIT